MYGVGGAQALWRLAQHRTHKSSLEVPLSREYAHCDAPSAEYWRTVEWVDHMTAWYGPGDLWI